MIRYLCQNRTRDKLISNKSKTTFLKLDLSELVVNGISLKNYSTRYVDKYIPIVKKYIPNKKFNVVANVTTRAKSSIVTTTNTTTRTKKYLFLDLDHTCFDGVKIPIMTNAILNSPYPKVHLRCGYSYKCVFRPYLLDFLRICSKEFDEIYVWTTATFEYALEMIDIIFNHDGIKYPKYIFSRENCPNMSRPKKDLKFAIKFLNNEVNLTNCILIDDMKSNCDENPKNSILVPAYHHFIENDCHLETISKYFQTEEFRTSDNLQSLNHNIFNKQITSTDKN